MLVQSVILYSWEFENLIDFSSLLYSDVPSFVIYFFLLVSTFISVCIR